MKSLISAFLTAAITGLLITAGCNLNEESNSDNAEIRVDGAAERPQNVSNGVESAEAPDKDDDDQTGSKDGKPEDPGKGEKDFIPEGWKQEDRVTGDLNGDSLPDTVLQIVREDSDSDYNRRMIVLFQTSNGNYAIAAEGRKVIRCTECYGTFGRGPADIKVEKGLIIVSQIYGSRWATDYLHRFRYEKATEKFLLIGEDINNFDRGTGVAETTSTNYLTGKQIVTKEKVDGNGEYVEVSRSEKSVTRTKKYLEGVDYKNY